MSERKNPDVIRIDDIAEPVLTGAQRQALTFGDANPVRFDDELVLETARQQTGLSDFGADDFRERLQVWCRAIEGDAELSGYARFGLWMETVRFASNRLYVEDLVKRHPGILDIPIDRPLIVAGLPRSGTTHLLQILSADPRLRSLPYWEAQRPVAAPYVVDGEDTRFRIADEGWVAYDAVLPYVKAIHEFSPEHVSEDYELQCLDFGSYYIEWNARIPDWRDYYLSLDHTSIYRYMRKGMQVLTWHGGPNRWVTKCPQHMEQLVSVNAAFPDAITVITHRDPVASIQSAITALGYSSRVTRTRIDLPAIRDYWIDRYERLLRRCVEQRDQIDDRRVVDVYFEDLVGDPVRVVGGVYETAGLDFDEASRATLDAALEANLRGRHGRVVYDLRRDFGIEPAEIRERFGFYFDRFPVQVEVR